MTARQKLLKIFYPFLILLSKISGIKRRIYENKENRQSVVSFYTLHAVANNAAQIDFASYKGKKVLLVNTASDCGYTSQLNDLQKLQDIYKEKLVVIGFPSNDFKEQEKGSDEEISAFCTLNFNVHFTLIQKSHVLKINSQHTVFEWLTNKNKNGWNNTAPHWNFTKYLVNEAGVLTHVFDTGISPLDEKVTSAVAE